MEITLVRRSEKTKNLVYSLSDVYEVLEAIKSGMYQEYVTLFREVYDSLKKDEEYRHYGRMYKVITASKYVKKPQKGVQYGGYTGIIALKFDGIADQMVLERVKADAMLLPQTLATFVGANGHSVVILTQAALPEMELPQTEGEAELFHIKAYRTAVMCYSPTLSRPITPEEPRLDASFLASVDAGLLMNNQAVPFIITQPNASR